MIRRDVFQAIADPGRRAIIALLSEQPMTLGSVAAHFDVSRPAVSKQVKVLAECGIVRIRQQGRERYCELQAGRLQEVADWAAQYRRFWNDKLDDLGTFLDTGKAPSAPTKSAHPRIKGK